MKQEDFEESIRHFLDRTSSVLLSKGKTYSTDDNRLHNFEVAAKLTGETVEQAIVGMMSKHIVSVFDMVNTDRPYLDEVWDEKIGDALNYLLILRAAIDHRNSETE